MYLTPFMLSQNIALDNALSTIQVIHQIISKVNGVIEFVNNLEVNSNKYTDEQIELLHGIVKDELSEVESNLKNLIKTNSDDIANIKSELVELHSTIKELNEDIKSNTDLIFSNYNVLILKIAELKDYIDSFINGLTVKVFSPVTGCRTNIQTALNDIYNLYQMDFGNISLKYVNKIFKNIVTIGNVNYNLSDIKFKHVKGLTTTLSTFKLYKNSETEIDIAIKQTFKDSHSYSFYQIVDWIIKAISKDNTGLTLSQISQSVSSMLYSSLGFYYTEYIPKNRAWI